MGLASNHYREVSKRVRQILFVNANIKVPGYQEVAAYFHISFTKTSFADQGCGRIDRIYVSFTDTRSMTNQQINIHLLSFWYFLNKLLALLHCLLDRARSRREVCRSWTFKFTSKKPAIHSPDVQTHIMISVLSPLWVDCGRVVLCFIFLEFDANRSLTEW